MYAASVEGLTADERVDFDAALAKVAPTPTLPGPRRALAAVPALDAERVSTERLAAIRELGGLIAMDEGA